MEPLLYGAKVDVAFAGHVHAYEHFSRVYMNTANACETVHITIGDGGSTKSLDSDFLDPQPQWSLFREASFELTIYNATHAPEPVDGFPLSLFMCLDHGVVFYLFIMEAKLLIFQNSRNGS